MELLIPLFLLALVGWLFVAPAVALSRTARLRQRVEDLEYRLAERFRQMPPPTSPPLPTAMPAPPPPAAAETQQVVTAAQAATPVPEPLVTAAATPPASVSPPLPPPLPPAIEPMAQPTVLAKESAPSQEAPVATSPFSLEQFVGAKLFAWIGGVALFFGIVFFVKYAFERELISPALRVAMGYATATALMAAGYWFRQRQAYRVLTQTLSATGILAFYGVTYAAHAWYQFPAFSIGFTFALMAVITATAFITAVRAEAESVAVLGLAGGFLTPALVSSGQDQPLILFSYIALLNAGLVALAWRQTWWRLLPLGAAGTALVEWGWRQLFFSSGGYAEGAATWGMAAVFGGFALAFAAVAVVKRQQSGEQPEPWIAALIAAASALLLSFDFLAFGSIASRPMLIYSLLLVASGGWLATGWFFPKLWMTAMAGSLLVMLHLAWWMSAWLTAELLPYALGINLLFGLLHLVFISRLIQRGVSLEGFLPGLIALVMLAVMGLPLLLLDRVSWLLWPPFLLAGGLALLVAVFTRTLWVGLASLGLTLLALLRWLVLLPRTADSLLGFVVVLGLAVLVFAAGAHLIRRFWLTEDKENWGENALLRTVQLAALTLPFLLLTVVPRLLPVPNPSLLFAAALGLSVTLQWLSRGTPWLAMVGWVGWLLVAGTWQSLHGSLDLPGVLMAWHTAVPALALALWWGLRRHFQAETLPVAAVGLLMTACLTLLNPVIDNHWPEWAHGLLPAAFALPWMLMALRLRQEAAPLPQQAWTGGLALWFATLFFPFQFDGHWLSLAWALEAAALCWLFTRLLHDGLRVGAGLLAALACGQLLLIPAGLSFSVAGALPMWLWLCLVYGGSGLALLAGANWLHAPHHRLGELPLRGLIIGLGGVVLFALLNLQIANAFSPQEAARLEIRFGEQFASDMTYSIAWGLFALALLLLGFWKKTAGARYAGVGLLLVTLAKLFLHDLDRVGSIYRIAAFLVVAVIALGASFLYQKMASPANATE